MSRDKSVSGDGRGHRARSDTRPSSSSQAAERLDHERRLAELEQRNAELEQERAALADNLAQAIDLYDKVPVGYLTIDRRGVIRKLNRAGARLLGDEKYQPIGKRFSSFLDEADRRPFADFLGRIFTVSARHVQELTLGHDGDRKFDVQAEAIPAADGKSCRLVLVDISERKRIEADVSQSNRELSAVTGLLAVLSSSLDSGSLLNRALRGVLDLTKFDSGSICLLDATGKNLELKARIGTDDADEPMFNTRDVPVGECRCGQSTHDLRPVLFVGDASSGARNDHVAIHRAGIRNFVAVPLTSRKRSLGVMCAYTRKPVKPSAYGIDLLCELGGPIGALLDNAMLLEGANRQIQEKQAALAALAEAERRLSTLIANLPGLVYRYRNEADWTTEYVSDGVELLTGHPRADFMEQRRKYADLVHPEERIDVQNRIRDAIRARESFAITYRIASANQGERWVWEQGRGVYDEGGICVALEGIVIDITDSKRSEELAKGQRQLLERIAAGAPLPDTLAAICRFIEDHLTGIRVSILLVDETGRHLQVGAAPSLPQEYIDAMQGQPIGMASVPCGVAAHLREPVYIADIATDPQWVWLRDMAARLGIRSVASSPIFDEQREVLATFALQGQEPGLPDPWQLRLIAIAAHVAAIAISRRRLITSVLESEAKFAMLFEKALFPTVLSRLADLKIVDVNAAFERTFGYSRQEVVGKTSIEIGLISDHDVREHLRNEFAQTRTFSAREVTVHAKSGEAVTVLINVDLLDLNGEPHLLSTAQVITALRRGPSN